MNPVITNVTVIYPNGQSYLSPGQTAEILVEAIDNDNRTITVTVEVADSSGNEVANVVSVIVTDPLTFNAFSEDSGVTVTQDPTQPSHFFVTLAS
jgi:hypothetical protein